MPLRLAYIDESFDSQKFCLSAVVIRHSQWSECLDICLSRRRYLRERYGVYVSAELHCRELIKGQGRSFANRSVSLRERSEIFRHQLKTIAILPRAWLFNVVVDVHGARDPQLLAWDRLLNRLQRTAEARTESIQRQNSLLLRKLPDNTPQELRDELQGRLSSSLPRFMIVADEGRELAITSVMRRMRRFNHIPSAFGVWNDGATSKNLPLTHIVEDPVFRPSHKSYFVQLADAAAQALFRKEVPVSRKLERYGIQNMFDEELTRICFGDACRSDPQGIVRVRVKHGAARRPPKQVQ